MSKSVKAILFFTVIVFLSGCVGNWSDNRKRIKPGLLYDEPVDPNLWMETLRTFYLRYQLNKSQDEIDQMYGSNLSQPIKR